MADDSPMRQADFEEELKTRFTYHEPVGTKAGRYADIRNDAHELAKLILEYCPDCRERSTAWTLLEGVVMWANAAIARRE